MHAWSRCRFVGREDLFLLAQDDLGFDAYSPTEFGTSWRARPFRTYSAALEPLAALAMLGLGLRLHQRLCPKRPEPSWMPPVARGPWQLQRSTAKRTGLSWPGT